MRLRGRVLQLYQAHQELQSKTEARHSKALQQLQDDADKAPPPLPPPSRAPSLAPWPLPPAPAPSLPSQGGAVLGAAAAALRLPLHTRTLCAWRGMAGGGVPCVRGGFFESNASWR